MRFCGVVVGSESRRVGMLAALLCMTSCFPKYGSDGEDARQTSPETELPDGPTPCGDAECSASEICIQRGPQWQGEDCDLVEVSAFCAPRLACDDLEGRDFLECQAGDRCGVGCYDELQLVDAVLHCDDTPCHCPNAYDEDTD